jgi:hypothetical protein
LREKVPVRRVRDGSGILLQSTAAQKIKLTARRRNLTGFENL